MESTNGVFLNGRRVRETILKSGSKIELGDTIFRFIHNDEIEEEFQSKIFDYATLDHMTGLYNKRFVIEELKTQCRISGRNNRIFSIVLIDIDDLKGLNEKFGHMGADKYIQEFANIIKEGLREQDIAGRFGGDEFLLILPETTVDGALKLLFRLKKSIECLTVNYKSDEISSTFSAGISQFILHAREAETLVEIADKALFKAKELGKNNIVNAEIEYD